MIRIFLTALAISAGLAVHMADSGPGDRVDDQLGRLGLATTPGPDRHKRRSIRHQLRVTN